MVLKVEQGEEKSHEWAKNEREVFPLVVVLHQVSPDEEDRGNSQHRGGETQDTGDHLNLSRRVLRNAQRGERQLDNNVNIAPEGA